jgi:hypothetical protein
MWSCPPFSFECSAESAVHGDDAPTFYLAKQGVGPLGQTDPNTRNFERTIANLTAVNPYTGATDPPMLGGSGRRRPLAPRVLQEQTFA